MIVLIKKIAHLHAWALFFMFYRSIPAWRCRDVLIKLKYKANFTLISLPMLKWSMYSMCTLFQNPKQEKKLLAFKKIHNLINRWPITNENIKSIKSSSTVLKSSKERLPSWIYSGDPPKINTGYLKSQYDSNHMNWTFQMYLLIASIQN